MIKDLYRLVIGLVMIFGVNKFYIALNTPPVEGDSLAYHIPIAQIVAEGAIWDETRYELPFYYYPAWGETILAGFIKIGVPLNLYNVFSWLVLWGVVFQLGRRRGLDKNWAVIFASTVALLNSVQRLVLTQTVDIWLAVWWVWVISLFEKKSRNIMDYFWIGAGLGMLVGTKYSGILFAIGLLVAYYPVWSKEVTLGKVLRWGMVFAPLAGWWFFRNWRLTGNPVYPQNLFSWLGDPAFHLMDWAVWKTIFKYPWGWWIWIQAGISEFLIWILAPAVVLVNRSRMTLLGFVALGVYLILPSWPENTLSDLRYTFPTFICLILAVFEWASRNQKKEFAAMAILTMAAVLPQLDYLPKVIFGTLMVYGIWVSKKNIFRES